MKKVTVMHNGNQNLMRNVRECTSVPTVASFHGDVVKTPNGYFIYYHDDQSWHPIDWDSVCDQVDRQLAQVAYDYSMDVI